jgi:hypothetical protein
MKHGFPTFRYGDLIEWMEGYEAEFEQWLEEFDPILRRRSSQPDPKEGS